jgi:hypothetical protein
LAHPLTTRFRHLINEGPVGGCYVEADNPVVFIDAFVDGLVLTAAGHSDVYDLDLAERRTNLSPPLAPDGRSAAAQRAIKRAFQRRREPSKKPRHR